jgi:hypothetical protein
MKILGSNPDHLSHPFDYKDVGKMVTAQGILKRSHPRCNFVVEG